MEELGELGHISEGVSILVKLSQRDPNQEVNDTKDAKDVYTAFTSFEDDNLMPTNNWGWGSIVSTQNCRGY